MMIGFDPVFYKKLEIYSHKMKVPMWAALQNMIVRRWAENAAKAAVWGRNPEILIEFSATEDGIISPAELHELAYQLAFQDEARERLAGIQEELAAGRKPSEEDEAFYQKYQSRYGNTLKNERVETDSFAYWESEMTDEDALAKLRKGKKS